MKEFDTLQDSAVILNSERRFHYCNEAFALLCGVPHKRFKADKAIEDFVALEADIWKGVPAASDLKEPTPYREMRFETPAGGGIAQYTIQSYQLPNGQPGYLLFFKDMTLEERLQAKYRAELDLKEDVIKKLDRKLFELTFLLGVSEATSAGGNSALIMDAVLKNLIKTFPGSLACFLGCSEPQGITSSFKLRAFHAINPEMYPDIKMLFLNPEGYRSDLIVSAFKETKTVQGPLENYQAVVVPLAGKNSDLGAIVLLRSPELPPLSIADFELFQAMANQVSLTIDNTELYLQSITDEMTKLFNNRYFHYRLNNELRRTQRTKGSFGLLFLDVDHFKKFNDTYGHQTGDVVLISVAAAIRAGARTTDIPARYGGEEFAVILNDTDAEGAMVVAERIRKNIESMELKTAEFGILKVTASVGISLSPEHSLDEKDLIECADKALYKAKGAGRNNSKLYIKEMG